MSFQQDFGVGTIINAAETLITVTTAQRHGANFLFRVRFHVDGDLYTGYQTGTQKVPTEAFDPDSIAVLSQFVIDSANFLRRDNGQLASKNEGGDSYTLRVTRGKFKVNTLEDRTNPTNGDVLEDMPGAFSHGRLELARMGAVPAATSFDETLDAVPAQTRRVAAGRR